MKTGIKVIGLMVLVIGLFSTTSCKKAADTLQQNTTQQESTILTEEETAETIETLLKAEDGGMTQEVSDVTQLSKEEYSNYQSNCNYKGDSTLKISKGGLRAYDYDLSYDWEVVCNGVLPQSFNFNSSRKGSYTGPRMEHKGSGSSNLVATDILPSQPQLILNGSHAFSGASIAVKRSKSVTTALTLNFNNVHVDKSNYTIASGDATFTLNASESGGLSTTITGSINFLGNGAATVTINNYSYTISI
ncbi:MAG: hypothetical protein GY810_08275 [Aureispira sp.]|nr:hypothetical protein [Aureispira sp.]